MSPYGNPEIDPVRAEFWEMCVRRDIEAFIAQDWTICAHDFQEPGFIGIDGRLSGNPDDWRVTFPTLASYREAWLQQSGDFAREDFVEDRRNALYGAISIAAVEFSGDTALIHKKFDGGLTRRDGSRAPLCWQSLYFARRIAGKWKLCGFVGYLPNSAVAVRAP